MSERGKHLFQFHAARIAASAKAEADYHHGRLEFWEKALEQATKRVLPGIPEDEIGGRF